MENLDAVGEHRRASLAYIEPAGIHFTDVRDQLGVDSPRRAEELRETSEQLVVGKGLELLSRYHDSSIARA
jgi:hypothetical protein